MVKHRKKMSGDKVGAPDKGVPQCARPHSSTTINPAPDVAGQEALNPMSPLPVPEDVLRRFEKRTGIPTDFVPGSDLPLDVVIDFGVDD